MFNKKPEILQAVIGTQYTITAAYADVPGLTVTARIGGWYRITAHVSVTTGQSNDTVSGAYFRLRIGDRKFVGNPEISESLGGLTWVWKQMLNGRSANDFLTMSEVVYVAAGEEIAVQAVEQSGDDATIMLGYLAHTRSLITAELLSPDEKPVKLDSVMISNHAPGNSWTDLNRMVVTIQESGYYSIEAKPVVDSYGPNRTDGTTSVRVTVNDVPQNGPILKYLFQTDAVTRYGVNASLFITRRFLQVGDVVRLQGIAESIGGAEYESRVRTGSRLTVIKEIAPSAKTSTVVFNDTNLGAAWADLAKYTLTAAEKGWYRIQGFFNNIAYDVPGATTSCSLRYAINGVPVAAPISYNLYDHTNANRRHGNPQFMQAILRLSPGDIVTVQGIDHGGNNSYITGTLGTAQNYMELVKIGE